MLPPLAAEAVRLLQALLRFDTSNPPGNERPAADYIAGVLSADGIAPTVIETAPGRGNVVARLRGDGSAAPLLLFSHLDVVPVERALWTVDPFGGEIRDGYVYGRGALDMKGIGAMQLAVFLDLARQAAAGSITLRRDLILAATADEETNANQGIGLLAARHPELLRAEYALTEFGGFPMRVAGKTFYPIQTAEKGTAWMTLRARGTPGHASVPRGDNAVVALARAVERLGTARLPMRLTATARAHIAGLADALGGPAAVALRAALSGEPGAPGAGPVGEKSSRSDHAWGSQGLRARAPDASDDARNAFCHQSRWARPVTPATSANATISAIPRASPNVAPSAASTNPMPALRTTARSGQATSAPATSAATKIATNAIT